MSKFFKTLFCVCVFSGIVSAQLPDAGTLALYHAEQCAQEVMYYMEFSGKGDNAYDCATEPYNKKYTFFYTSGEPFRIFEARDNMLNGAYLLFYRNGNLFSQSLYKNNLLVDSALIYYPDKQLKTKLIYKNENEYILTDYYPSGERGHSVTVTNKPCSTPYTCISEARNKAYLHIYWDKKGEEITEKKYLKANPATKED